MIEPLYSFQSGVIPKIVRGEPTYLGFDPGLGKSRTALEAAKAKDVKRLLIVAPASGRYVWERECRKWWPEMPFTLVRGPDDLRPRTGALLVTYGLLSQKRSPVAAAIAVDRAFGMTILDEAAAVKSSGANRTKAVLQTMLPKLGYLLPMSGTPAPNHAGELYTILRAVYPKAILKTSGTPMLEYEFQDAFCRVVEKRFARGSQPVRVIEGSKNMPELRRRMEGFMVRVRKADVLKDLPAIRWDVVPVQPKLDSLAPLPAVPAGLSDEDLLKWLSGAGGDHVMRLRRLLGVAKADAAIEYIDDFLTNLPQDRKVLVFAHHREVIKVLDAGLGNWSPAVVTGSSSPGERTVAINRFLENDRCRVLIGNIQAAGTGLTLVGPRCRCSDVFFVEATYSVGDNHQAACRVHRIGQRDGVVARFLTAHGTIDDRIHSVLARKAQDFEQLFD